MGATTQKFPQFLIRGEKYAIFISIAAVNLLALGVYASSAAPSALTALIAWGLFFLIFLPDSFARRAVVAASGGHDEAGQPSVASACSWPSTSAYRSALRTHEVTVCGHCYLHDSLMCRPTGAS